ncbi:hypothetical protein D3C76_1183690 [compost metagenome]
MEDRKGTSATKAKNKYNAANYDRLYPYVQKGRKAEYEAAAKAAGVSLNDYIITAIEEKMQRDKKFNREDIKEYKGYWIFRYESEEGYRVDFGTKRSKQVVTTEEARQLIDYYLSTDKTGK